MDFFYDIFNIFNDSLINHTNRPNRRYIYENFNYDNTFDEDDILTDVIQNMSQVRNYFDEYIENLNNEEINFVDNNVNHNLEGNICRDYEQGYCSRGDRCTFQHVPNNISRHSNFNNFNNFNNIMNNNILLNNLVNRLLNESNNENSIFEIIFNNANINIELILESLNLDLNNLDLNNLEDIKIVLTTEQFNKLNTFKIKDDKKLDSNCTICLENFNKDNMITELKCKHFFHTECIKEWLTKNSSKCCICRVDMRNNK